MTSGRATFALTFAVVSTVSAAHAQTSGEPPPPAPATPPSPEGPPNGPSQSEVAPTVAPPPPEETTATSAEAVNDLQPPDFWNRGGVLIGDSTVLHPAVSLTGAYQSNVFFQDTKDTSGIDSSGILRVGVGATWSSLSSGRMEIEPAGGGASPRVVFSLDGNLEWNQYLSSNNTVSSVSDLGIGFLGDVKINPDGAVSFNIHDGFTRNVNPSQSAVAENTTRDRNEASAQVHFKPGGGALDIFLGYTLVVDLFEHKVIDYANRITNQGSLGVRWQWLPRTVISFDASIANVSPNDTTLKSSSTPFRATLGVSTLLTPILGVVAQGGYGNGFYSSGENVSTWLALAELRLAIGPTVRTAFGYSHDFADALFGNFYIDHTPYARASAQLGARWQIHAKAEVRFRTYGGIKDAPGLVFCGDASCPKTRSDTLPRVEVGTDYAILPWLLFGGLYVFQSDSTDFFARSGSNVDYGAYTWHEFDLRVQAKW